MTTAELIAKIKDLPPDTKILIEMDIDWTDDDGDSRSDPITKSMEDYYTASDGEKIIQIILHSE